MELKSAIDKHHSNTMYHTQQIFLQQEFFAPLPSVFLVSLSFLTLVLLTFLLFSYVF